MSDYSITLSTTEPNNYVGLIKLRQGDVASQSIQATITANGQLFNFDNLSVFFNAVLPNGNVIRDKVTEVDYVNSKLSYVVADSFLQEVTQVTAWFSFENGDKIIDSTKNFQYSVIAGWKESIPQGNYIYELSEIQREIEEIIGNKDFSSLLNKIGLLETNVSYLDNTKADKDEMNVKIKLLNDLKADKTLVDAQFASIVSGAPKGTFTTLNALKEAYPKGTEGVFLVLENGHWYYYANGWLDGGVYQATEIGDNSITSVKRTKIGDFAIINSTNYFNFDTINNTLIFPASGGLWINIGVSAYDLSNLLGSSLDLSGGGTNVVWIVYNTQSNSINTVFSGSGGLGEYDVVIGFKRGTKSPTIYFNGLYTINSYTNPYYLTTRTKRYLATGDSITDGAVDSTDAPSVLSYSDFVDRFLCFNQYTKDAVRGSTYAVRSGRTDSAVERCASWSGVHYLTIFFGMNDFTKSVPLGKRGIDDLSTFYGAVEYVYKTVLTNNSAAKILIITPPKNNKETSNPSFTPNAEGLIQSDYVNVILELADYYSLPVLNLYKEDGMSPFIDKISSRYRPDKLHYNEDGYRRLAEKVADKIITL